MKKIIVILLVLFFVSFAYSLSVSLDLNQNTGNEPLDVNLTANIPDGVSPYVFEWDFDGDGVNNVITNTPTNSVIHTYSTGYYTAKVMVTDLINEHAEMTAEISVANSNGNFPPTATANGPYVVAPNQKFLLDPAGSDDQDGEIKQYRWKITTLTGDPQCPKNTIIVKASGDSSGQLKGIKEKILYLDDAPGDPEEDLPQGATLITCKGIGTAELRLEVRDDGSPYESATYITTITVKEIQTANLIDIVKMTVKPELIKKGENLEAIVTVRNVTNRIINFDLYFEVKLNKADANISALPNLITGLKILNKHLNANEQREFTITITQSQLERLTTQKNYWVYAKAESSNTETNTIFNTRRAIFSYNEMMTLNLAETNFIGIMLVLLAIAIISRK